MDYIIYLVLFGFIIYFLFYIRNYIRCVMLAFKLNGPPVLPILGNVLVVNDSKKLELLGTKASEMYGSFMRFWISFLPFIFIYEPRHLKIILSSKSSEKNIFYNVLKNIFGKGLITINGVKWKSHRKLIQPYFHLSMLEKYINIFSESAEIMLKRLEGQTDVKISSFINQCTLSILHKTVLGIDMDVDGLDSPYRKGNVILTQRISKPWLLLDTFFKYTRFARGQMDHQMNIYNYTKKVLQERRNGVKPLFSNSLLDLFIEEAEKNKEFTDDDLINEAMTFMIAGQDSVSVSLAFTLYFLAKHGDVQEKIVEELNNINPDFSNLTLANLDSMKYLEQCLKESMRLIPGVPALSRVLTEDVVLDGYTFPVGTNIIVCPFITHRLPHVFPDPLKFDPDRFSEKNLEKLHPYAFIPFSMGFRNCIGYKYAYLEMKSIVAIILNRYKLSLAPGHENLQITYRLSIGAKGGIWVRLNHRT